MEGELKARSSNSEVVAGAKSRRRVQDLGGAEKQEEARTQQREGTRGPEGGPPAYALRRKEPLCQDPSRGLTFCCPDSGVLTLFGRVSTVVSAYCTPARTGPPVSLPVDA